MNAVITALRALCVFLSGIAGTLVMREYPLIAALDFGMGLVMIVILARGERP